MISVKSLTKKYGDKAVVDDVSFSLPQNQIVAFIGSNGAGKSTILSILSRLISANEGEVELDGKNLKEWDTKEISKKMSILSQSNHMNIRLTVKELVEFGRFPYSRGKLTEEDHQKVEESLEYTGLKSLENRYLDELSGGQCQMAYIAMAISQDTPYILLDEPLNNLDMSRSVKIMKLLRRLVEEKQKTVIIVIHDINFVSCYADYIIAMKDGRVRKCGKRSEIITEEVLSDIYDMPITIERFGEEDICLYYT